MYIATNNWDLEIYKTKLENKVRKKVVLIKQLFNECQFLSRQKSSFDVNACIACVEKQTRFLSIYNFSLLSTG